MIPFEGANASLFFRQGVALFEQNAHLAASRALNKACSLLPNFFEALSLLCRALLSLGLETKQFHYILRAQKIVERALALKEDFTLHWTHGRVQREIARRSEEPADLFLCLQAFARAQQMQGSAPAEFWIDYGEIYLTLAETLEESHYQEKAELFFTQSQMEKVISKSGAKCLAACFSRLFALTHEESHFESANQNYFTASQDSSLLHEWAKLLILAAKTPLHEARLKQAIKQCKMAYQLPYSPEILATWAEASSYLAVLLEKRDLLIEAEKKAEAAASQAERNPEVLYSLGVVYQCQGHFFEDCDAFYLAIETYQMALSIDSSRPKLWHAMGSCYLHIFQINGDEEAIQHALHFLQKTLSLKASGPHLVDYAVALSRLGEMNRDQAVLELAKGQFDLAILALKGHFFSRPEWVFSYAYTLDLLADFYDEMELYQRSIDLFSHLLIIDPNFPEVHHRLAVVLCHLAELSEDINAFLRADQFFRIASRQDEENEQLAIDWASNLIYLAIRTQEPLQKEHYFAFAEKKLLKAVSLGSLSAYYPLACLHSLRGNYGLSLQLLHKAKKHKTLPASHELMEDEWLEGLRSTEAFQEFLLQYER